MKHIKQILLLCSILWCTGCSQETTSVSKHDEIIVLSHDYLEIKEYELSWEEIFGVDQVSYYVYFYSQTCDYCIELKNYIIEKALERGDIYFIRASKSDQLTNDPKKAIGAGIPGDIWILGYPTLLKIHNKICTKNLAGINEIKGELN